MYVLKDSAIELYNINDPTKAPSYQWSHALPDTLPIGSRLYTLDGNQFFITTATNGKCYYGKKILLFSLILQST